MKNEEYEFKTSTFDEMYNKDKAGTLLELKDFINGLNSIKNELEKQNKKLQEDNDSLTQSNSRMFLRLSNEENKDSDINDVNDNINNDLYNNSVSNLLDAWNK